MNKVSIALLVSAGMVAAASAGQINLKQTAMFDLGGEFTSGTANGASPSAVAWDGGNLFVAGFASAGGSNTTDAGIVKYDASGNFVSQFGARPGTPFNRGYSGLDISGGQLVAAYDNGGVDSMGISAFDLNGAMQWSVAARGGSGVAFDTGFNGAGQGVAWTTFGSGRRALQDSATGVNLFTTGDGMIITPDFQGTFWRDMDFGTNGDMVARRSNDVVLLNRTGANSGSASLLVENNENGAFVGGQNVSYVESSEYGDFVIYNDRATTNLGQSAGDVLKAVRLDGSTVDLNFFGGPGFDLGSGYYDFSWDAATQTLAILDFQNRKVFIYNVPMPGAGVVLGMGGLMAVRRRR